MFYFFGVKGVIRSYRSAQELKADTLPAHALGDFALNGQRTSLSPLGELEGAWRGLSHLALTSLTPLTPKKLSNLRNLSQYYYMYI